MSLALCIAIVAALFLGEGLNPDGSVQESYLGAALLACIATLGLAIVSLRPRPTWMRLAAGIVMVGLAFGALVITKEVILMVQENHAERTGRNAVDKIHPYPGAVVRKYIISREHNGAFANDFWDLHNWYTLTRTDVTPRTVSLAAVAAHYTRELRKTGCEFGPVSRRGASEGAIAAGEATCPVGSSTNARVAVYRTGGRMTILVSTRV